MPIAQYHKRRDRKSRRLTLPELEEQVSGYEGLVRETGAESFAKGAWERTKGAGRLLIDLLSRPSYATAGAYEEWANTQSVTGAFLRASREILSGIGPIQGEKREWVEVLERQGYDTTTLGEAVPFMDETWIANWGSRGAFGMVLNVATDPLTYVTFGTGGALRVLTKAGARPLNKAGLKLYEGIQKEVDAGYRLVELGNPARTPADRIFRSREQREAMAELLEDRMAKLGGAEKFTEPKAVRWFGKPIVENETLARNIGEPVLAAMNAIPGGRVVLKGVQKTGEAMSYAVKQMFSPEGKLAHLPPEIREQVWSMHRDFMNSTAAHRGRYWQLAYGVEKQYQGLLKQDPGLGKKFYEIVDGKRALDTLTDAERQVFLATTALTKQLGGSLVKYGVLPPQILAKPFYLPHRYKNAEALRYYHHNVGTRFRPGDLSADFERKMVFDGYDQAVQRSAELNRLHTEAITQGKKVAVYPVLDPDYDVFKNLYAHINDTSESIFRKAFREEAVIRFGQTIDEFDPNWFYEFAAPVREALTAAQEAEDVKIDRWFGKTKSFRKIEEEYRTRVIGPDRPFTLGRLLQREPGGGVPFSPLETPVPGMVARTLPGTKVKGPKGAGEERLFETARNLLTDLSPDGKREFMRRMLLTSRSGSQVAEIHARLWDDYGEFFPRAKYDYVQAGQIEPTLVPTLGAKWSEYVVRAGSFYGDEPVKIPRAIADDIEALPTSIFNTKDHDWLKRVLNVWDSQNNIFKLLNYVIWPASATRDAYSNVFLSAMDIGVQALNPRLMRDSIRMAMSRGETHVGTITTKSGMILPLHELEQQARITGTVLPGEAFFEWTGEKMAQKWLTDKAQAALVARGAVENFSRRLLFLANVRRGADPRLAADHVAKFLFNYGEVSSFHREWVRRFIPFSTFTVKNLELHARLLATKPGAVSIQAKLFAGRESENEQMVKFEAEGLKLRLNKDGRTVTMLTGIDIPIRNLDQLWAGTGRESMRRFLGMFTPAVKVPLEWTTGTDFFTGNEMKRTRADVLGRALDNSIVPQRVKNWAGLSKRQDEYTGKTVYELDSRRLPVLVRAMMFSRFVSTSDRVFREYLDDETILAGFYNLFTNTPALADVLTGVRFKNLDLDEQRYKLLLERRRLFLDALQRRGVLRTFEVPGKPRVEAVQ